MKLFLIYFFIVSLLLFGQGKRDSRDLGMLTFSGDEVQNIIEYLNGDMFIHEQIGKDKLLKILADYDIIHLATHTLVDEVNPLQSKFYISTNKTEEESAVFASDILPLNLNAKMAVLSSCNTGIGELIDGEGIMSLARDFQFAGVPSVVMTLWEVNDISTSEIMKSFYSGLSKKVKIDDALRVAKLEYLQNSNSKNSAPVFWAASVPIGDMGKIVFQKSSYNWIYPFIIPAGFFIWFLYRRRKILAEFPNKSISG